MRRLSKLGAGALALMLSATLVLPITASAAQGHDYETNWDRDVPVSVIDTDTKEYKFAGSDTSETAHGYDRDKAELAAWNQALAQGFVKQGSVSKYDKKLSVYERDATTGIGRTVYYYFLFLEDGWYDSQYGVEVSQDYKTYTYYLKLTKTTYKNNITGETSTNRNDLVGEYSTENANAIQKKATVYTGDYRDIYVGLDAGNIKIKNVKSSNKKAIQARAYTSYVKRTTDNYSLSKNERGYYFNSYTSGEDVYVAENAIVNQSRAVVYIRVFGKKAGKSVISFDIYDINNKKTGSAKINVVSSKSKPIDSITFGGKSLEQSDVIGASDSKYIYNKKDINTFYNYTTAKSGKLKVTPNENYKLIRIQVGTLEKYKGDNSKNPEYESENYTSADKSKVNKSSIETTGFHPVDLNKDGDYDDVVNGISERNVKFRYKTVKNNKKITLSKVTEYSKSITENGTTYNSDTARNTWTKETFDDKGDQNVAPTEIKITLYNRTEKSYIDVYYTIYKKVKSY